MLILRQRNTKATIFQFNQRSELPLSLTILSLKRMHFCGRGGYTVRDQGDYFSPIISGRWCAMNIAAGSQTPIPAAFFMIHVPVTFVGVQYQRALHLGIFLQPRSTTIEAVILPCFGVSSVGASPCLPPPVRLYSGRISYTSS